MDNLLLITVLTIFVAAFVGSMIRYRTRDKCLKEFTGYFITLDMKDGKRMWGKLHVYHNGLELVYPSPHLDPDGSHFETSYIIYENQYPQIFALKRLHDELTKENQARRKKDIKQTYHPNFFRRCGRSLRNLFNLLRDAFGQAITVFIGHIKKTGGSTLVATQDGRIQNTAKQLISASAAAYEPILEKYIGRKVVLEAIIDGKKHEYCGILKEYTDSFVTLLDVPIHQEHEFNLANPEQLKVNRNLDFEVTSEPSGKAGVDLHIRLYNHGKEAVHVCHAEGPAYSHIVDKEVTAGETIDFALPGVPLPEKENEPAEEPADAEERPQEAPAEEKSALPDLRLWIRAHRYMDMVVPRSLGTIRHGAESIGQLNIKFFLKLTTP